MSYAQLILPVLASAVAVFIASSVLHMIFKYHNADYKRLPDEDAVGEAMRKSAPAPGLYLIPHCVDQGQMKDPAVQAKYAKGPVALIAVMRNGLPGMGKALGLWFGYCVLISVVAGYVARLLGAGADGIAVLRVTGSVAFAAYGLSAIQSSIWAAVPWPNTLRSMIDGLIYAVITGFVFSLLR